ncbi:MAG: hypothetical protein K0U98_27055 [Deltaproteobacteria bacterium]|nr:hypothetical protein [Deltaproteobacteria bacterium]
MPKKMILPLALAFFALSLVAVAATPEAPVANVEAPSTEQAPAEIPALQLDQCEAEPLAFRGPGPRPHCGDPCTGPPGGGCIDTSGSSARKVPCACINGYFVCN